MSHPFGDLVSQHLHRKHGLSQSKLAAGILQPPMVITAMCKGKRLTGPRARERVVSIINWLQQQGALATLNEANALLNAASMSSLNGSSSVEVALVRSLQASDRSAPTPHTHTSVQNVVVRRTNLPAQLTSFVGRERETAELTEQVKTARLLTLAGAGGVGKTRLSLEIGRNLPDAFPDGVWLVELAPMSDPALLAQTVTNVFKLPEQPDRTHLDMLVGYLETKHLLLILDNCEHLIDACATLIEALLQRCSQLHVLATSRETLRLPGEVMHRVPSLTTPDGDMPPDNLLSYESVRLFRERATTSQPMFEWSASNASAVAHICSRLDGIPLAIELAVARLNVLSAEQIAKRLTDRFNLLVTGSRTALPRHQTLRAAITWSYDLLTQSEQALLMRLSVFAGGFTAEAAQFVSGQLDALTLLSSLVDKSLVIVEVKDNAMRYHLLETIRQFAAEQLQGQGQRDTTRDQHLAYFVALSETAETEMRDAKFQSWKSSLEDELDNLRAALAWSLEGGACEQGLRLAGALWQFWFEDHFEGPHWCERLLLKCDEAPAAVRAKALYGTGMILWIQGNKQKLAQVARQSLALCQSLHDEIGIAFSLICLGSALEHSREDVQEATTCYEEALELLEDAQHPWGVMFATIRLGWWKIAQGDFERADRLLKKGVTLAQALDNVWSTLDGLGGLTDLAMKKGDLVAAKAFTEERIALTRTRDERPNAWILHVLGDIALQEGDHRRAKELYEQCLVVWRAAGYASDKEAWSLRGLGHAARMQGDYQTAARHLNESLAIYQELGDEADVAFSHLWLGHVALDQGEGAVALSHFHESASRYLQLGNQPLLAVGVSAISQVLQMRGDVYLAIQLCGAAASYDEAVRAALKPHESADYERTIADARLRLGDPVLEAAWDEGRAMTLEQVIEYVLSVALRKVNLPG